MRALTLSCILACGCTAVIEGRLSDKPSEDETAGSGAGAGDSGGATTTITSSSTSGAGAGGSTTPTGGGGGSLPPCAPNDAFDDGMIDSQWSFFADVDVMLTESDALQIAVAGGAGNRWGRMTTVMPHDATMCGLTISFEGTLASAEMAYAELIIDIDNRVGFHLVGSELRLREEVANVPDQIDVVYSPVTDRWWRIVREGAEFVWYTSDDGIIWNQRRRKPSTLDPTSMQVLLGAGVVGSSTAGFSVQFDQLNLPP